MDSKDVLKRLGEQIRLHRATADLTQAQLGAKAGIVGKYVSEIERGTRDIPISTLHAIVEKGLSLRLELDFRARNGSRPHIKLPPLPRPIEEMARLVAALDPDDCAEVVAIVKSIAGLVKR